MNPVTALEVDIQRHISEQTPERSPELLSKAQRDRAIERSFLGLYRWYTDRSQATRNWNPDRSFAWKNLRQDLSDPMIRILEGFFAVEQFNPDYTSGIVNVIRKSYGRAGFQVRWGNEEQKHSDLWRNCLLFSKRRSADWIEQYSEQLRENSSWSVPWDDPVRMLLYQVVQERATQLNYLNMAAIARGEQLGENSASDVDSVLAEASRVIAIDEAAHYNFFLEGARLFFYYYPEETAQALLDVLRFYAMPARDLVPGYAEFAAALNAAGIFSPRRHYVLDTLETILGNLGIESLNALDDGIKRCRLVPDSQGALRETTLFESLNYRQIEDSVKRLAGKIRAFEDEIGLSEVDSYEHLRNPAIPGCP